MKIKLEQVKHIAELSRLEINEAEMEAWSEQMGAVIEFADKLNELDIAAEELSQLKEDGPYNVFRKDERGDSYPPKTMLANAPEQYEGCYVVPKIVE